MELEGKNYEKALAYMEIALEDEGLKSRGEVEELKSIVEAYLLGEKHFEEGEVYKARTILEKVNPKYKDYIVAEDIDGLSSDLAIVEKEIRSDFDDLAKSIGAGDLNLARSLYKSMDVKALSDEDKKLLEDLEKNLARKEVELSADKAKAQGGEAEKVEEKETTKKIYTGEDSWKNYNHKRPDHVNKRIEENKNRHKKYR